MEGKLIHLYCLNSEDVDKEFIVMNEDVPKDKTKIVLQIFKENKATLSNCFGNDLYDEIKKDYENKIEFLENEKPSLTTRFFFGDSPVAGLPIQLEKILEKLREFFGDVKPPNFCHILKFVIQ